MSASAMAATVQRVRASLARLERPLVALEHITQAADAHLHALAPEFAALDAVPFESVAVFQTERRPALAEEARPARRVPEPSIPAVRSARPLEASVSPAQPGVAPPTSASPAPPRFAARVLPPRPRAQLSQAAVEARVKESVREQNETTKYRLGRIAETNRISELVSGIQRALADASSALAQKEREDDGDGQRVDFATLVRSALQRSRARSDAEGSKESSPKTSRPVATTSGRAEPGIAQGALFRPAAGTRRAGAPPAVVEATRTPPDTAAGATQRAATAELTPERPAARARVPFYFNPLEERPTADDADDALAERIGQVLREQARRQGVDLT